MKTTLAITGVLLASMAANAANLSLSATITAVGGDGDHGSATGSYNPVLSTLNLGASDISPTGVVTKITLTSPANSVLATVTSIIAGANNSYAGIFSSVSAPGLTAANAANYIIKFYAGTTLVAKGGLHTNPASTPEPQTYAMVAGAALVGFAAFRRARR